MKKSIINIFMLFMLLSFGAKAVNYTWVGGTSTAWNTNANWSPSTGHPASSSDIATITGSGTYQPVLPSNLSLYSLIISGGTLNLNNDTLTLTTGNCTFSGGTISGGGLLKMRGAQMTFSATTISVPIDAIVATVTLNGGTFNNYCYFETTNNVPGSGSGGCTFNDSTYFFHNYSGSGIWRFNTSTGNRFNGKVRLKNISTAEMTFGGAGINVFNGDIIMESTNDGGIYFGNDTLKSGHTISIGSAGYNDGEFRATSFYQEGQGDIISLNFTGTALPTLDGATFKGLFSITSNIFLFKNCNFYGSSDFTATGSGSSSWYGGNKFYDGLFVTNNASAGNLKLDASAPNTYYGPVSFGGTRELRACYGNDTSLFYGDISAQIHVTFTAGTGTIKFTGGNVQVLDISNLEKVIVNKTSGNVTLFNPLSVSGLLKLQKGNIVSSSSSLLTLTSTASVSGASDSSFIDGPVKKIGNSAFVFPTGKNGSFRAFGITAPSNSTDAFTAEYFDGDHTNDITSRQSSLAYINTVNYWNLNRNTGSSQIKPTLYWNIQGGIPDTGRVKITRWNGSQWTDLGSVTKAGNNVAGSVSSTTNINSFGNFTLAFSALAFQACGANDNLPDLYYTFDQTGNEYKDIDPSTGTPGTTMTGGVISNEYSQAISTGGVSGSCFKAIRSGNNLQGGIFQIPADGYFAVEMYVKFDKEFLNQESSYLFRLTNGGNGVAHFALIDRNEIQFYTGYSGASGDALQLFTISLDGENEKSIDYYTDDNWHHLCFVNKPITGGYRKEIWVDGKLYNNFSKDILSPTIGDVDGELTNAYLELKTVNAHNNFTGYMDEVAVYASNEICPKVIEEHGLTTGSYDFTSDASAYTNVPFTNASQYDENDYPIGYAPGSGFYDEVKSAREQIESFPLSRYPRTINLRRNVNWLSSHYLAGYIGGTPQTSSLATEALAIQEELYKNWYYLFNLCENSSDYLSLSNQKYITHATPGNPGDTYELAILTNRAQLNYSSITLPGSIIASPSNSAWIVEENIENAAWTTTVTKKNFYLYKDATHWYNFRGDPNPQKQIGTSLVNDYFWNYSPLVLPTCTTCSTITKYSVTDPFIDNRSIYATDGLLQREILDLITTGITAPIKMVSENNEVSAKPTFEFKTSIFGPHDNPLIEDFDSQFTPTNEHWEEYMGKQAEQLDNDYRDGFMTLTKLSSALFLNYAVDAQDFTYDGGGIYVFLPRYRYDELRTTQKPVTTFPSPHSNFYFSTPDFYPRNPSIWLRESLAADHGFKWLTRSKRKELSYGDYLSAPFVAPGWSRNEEDNVRPGQWLGLLKANAMLGIDFFHVFANPQDVHAGGYAWQAATPVYAHAIASRISDYIINGSLLEGDILQDPSIPGIYMYAFNGGSPNELIVARKLNGAKKFAITGSVQPLSNIKNNAPLEKEVKILLKDNPGGISNTYNLQFKVRRQGSTYIFDADGTNALFYQLDSWHDYKHPERWSKDFSFEAEVYDGGSSFTPPIRKTENPSTHLPITNGDFRNYTSYITISGGSYAEYDFQPRQTSDYYIWIKARSASGTGVLNITPIVNGTPGTTQSMGCIAATSDFVWYKFQAGTMLPVKLTGLTSTNKYSLKIDPNFGTIDVDQVIISEDKELGLQPQPDYCSATCSVTDYTISAANLNVQTALLTVPPGTTLIYLNNSLTVNTNTTFNDMYFICAPGVKINIDPTYTLTLNNCHFVGCNIYLWGGIVVETSDSRLVIDNSTIEDAATAVYLSGLATGTVTNISITNTLFDHNNISIDGAGKGCDYSGMVIYGCEFRCKDRDVFEMSDISDHHISLLEGYNIEIGNKSQKENIFSDAWNNAIYLDIPREVNIENNRFSNIHAKSHTGNNIGSAIKMYYFDHRACPIAARSINDNIIENCDYGIVGKAVSATIQDNIINNTLEGITFVNCYGNIDPTDHIIIKTNTISMSDNGINSDRNVSNIIEVSGNLIYTPVTSSSLKYTSSICVNSFAGSFNELEIQSNYINSKGTYGITVTNEKNQLVNPILKDNFINLLQTDSAGQRNWGIKMNNCFSPSLCSNNIQGNDDDYMAAKYGIQLENCPQSGLNCNTINRVERGTIFVSDCSSSTLVSNHYDRLLLGIVVGNESSSGSVIGTQIGYLTNTVSNQYNGPFGGIGPFTGSGYKSFRINNTSNTEDLWYENDLTSNYEILSTENGVLNALPFVLKDYPSSLYSCGSSCPGAMFTGNDELDKLLEVANDTLSDDDILRNTSAYRKLNLLDFLVNNANWLDSSSVLQDFYDSSGIANVGKLLISTYYNNQLADTSVFGDARALENAIDDAESANSDLTLDETYVSNQKSFNSIYYYYTENPDSVINATDSTTLEFLANQCPYAGGNAVYEARTLLEILKGKVYYDDAALCQSAVEELRMADRFDDNKITKQRGSRVYPNPTKGILYVDLYGDIEGSVITIMDITGRKVLSSRLSESSNISKININYLTPGSYYYSINMKGKIETGKVILIK